MFKKFFSKEINENLISEFIQYLEDEGLSESTRISYRTSLLGFADWLKSKNYSIKLDTILPKHLVNWIEYQQIDLGAMPASINLRITALSRFFKWSIDNNYSNGLPTLNIKHLDRGRPEYKSLDNKEASELLLATDSLRDKAIIQLMLSTGLRVSEVINLKQKDIKWIGSRGILIIRRSKGGKFRKVPLTETTCKYLKNYLATIPNEKEYLWIGTRGNLKSSSAIKKLLKRLNAKVGIEHLHPHKLRHTFAHMYLEANKDDFRGLADILGHSDMKTTMRYTVPSMDDLLERSERVSF